MYFSTDIHLLVIVLLSIAAVSALVAVCYCGIQCRRIVRVRNRCDNAGEGSLEPVSVVIYSQDEAEALDVLLRSILTQDYPAPMEVIVVNEGDSADVRDVVAALQPAYPGLYLTHTPDGARNLSRKKLALTLGIKAARYDTVVLTAVGARIRSEKWLRSMMRHFGADSAVEVVIGYAAQMPDDDSGRGARCRAFDSAVSAARWLGSAAGGHPFRGTELNLAYRRAVFFRNKGFSRSLNLHFGDDDIFISEIADGRNTAVELGSDSIVGVLAHDYSFALHRLSMRHAFTESHIRRRPRVWSTVASVSVPMSTAAAVSAMAICPQNGVVVSAGALLLVVLVAGVTVAWRRMLRAFDMRVLGASIFPLALGYPVRRAMLRVRSRLSRQKRYTWD